MAEYGWIKVSFLMVTVLQMTAAVTGNSFRSCVVRVGGDVTLPCENMKKDQHNCEGTTWLFNDKGQALPHVERGKIHKNVEAKSHRLSVTENCSLVIKNVTAEDAGHYFCRQFKSGNQHGGDVNVYLSVTTREDVGWWRYIVASVGVAALLIIVGAVVAWMRKKATTTWTADSKAGDGVSYVTVKFPKRSDSTDRIRGLGDAVTYSAVKASHSAEDSADPSSLYATID